MKYRDYIQLTIVLLCGFLFTAGLFSKSPDQKVRSNPEVR